MKKIQIESVSIDELLHRLSVLVKANVQPTQPKVQLPYTWLTRQETAQLFKISLRSLHNWNQHGLLKPYSIGSRIYYRSDEVEKALTVKK